MVDDIEMSQTVEATNSTSEETSSIFLINSFKTIKSIFIKLVQLNLDATELEFFKLITLMRYGKLLN